VAKKTTAKLMKTSPVMASKAPTIQLAIRMPS
jgi:hypothetical protein